MLVGMRIYLIKPISDKDKCVCSVPPTDRQTDVEGQSGRKSSRLVDFWRRGPGLETVRTHNADAAAQTLCHHTRMSISTAFFAAQFSLLLREWCSLYGGGEMHCATSSLTMYNQQLTACSRPPIYFWLLIFLLLIFYFNGSVLLISPATTTGLGNYFVLCILHGGRTRKRERELLFQRFV